MATFLVTLTIVHTITVDIPDSKLKSLLENDCASITEYVETTFTGMPKNIEVTIEDTEVTVLDYSYIEKSNGNEYEWDGETLAKV